MVPTCDGAPVRRILGFVGDVPELVPHVDQCGICKSVAAAEQGIPEAELGEAAEALRRRIRAGRHAFVPGFGALVPQPLVDGEVGPAFHPSTSLVWRIEEAFGGGRSTPEEAGPVEPCDGRTIRDWRPPVGIDPRSDDDARAVKFDIRAVLWHVEACPACRAASTESASLQRLFEGDLAARLCAGQRAVVPGVGVFENARLAARTGIHSQTGERVQVPRRALPVLVPSP